MKKILYIPAIIIVICFLGCMQNNREKTSPEIILFLSDFVAKNPNLGQNDVVNKQIADSFKILLSENLNMNKELLNSIPLQLSEVREYADGKYSVNLKHYYTDIYEKDGIKFDLNFNVIGLIDAALVNNIRNNSKYYIRGNFIDFIISSDARKYIYGMIYSPSINIEKKYKMYKVTLGIMLFEIEEMNLVN